MSYPSILVLPAGGRGSHLRQGHCDCSTAWQQCSSAVGSHFWLHQLLIQRQFCSSLQLGSWRSQETTMQ